MPERIVTANGLSIWAEAFGNPNDTPLLLIAGATAQAIFWEEDFCQQLADAGCFVIRYDQRDTGRSDSVDFASAPYAVSALADDAVGILDAYQIPAAHAIGVSGGGLVCQELAREHRDRVITISALLSSLLGTGSGKGENGGYGDLPQPAPAFLENLQELVSEMPVDREGFIAWSLRKYQLIRGTLEPFDREAHQLQAEREFDRAQNLQAMNNHALAFAGSPPHNRQLLRNLEIPTLVVHGTQDPMLPYAHGKAIAETIPGASLRTIDKMGHDLPRAAWPQIIAAILEHTAT